MNRKTKMKLEEKKKAQRTKQQEMRYIYNIPTEHLK